MNDVGSGMATSSTRELGVSHRQALVLAKLIQSRCCLSREFTSLCAQACVVCLNEAGHASGASLVVQGDFTGEYAVIWPYEVTTSMLRTWTERNYTTDHAACAIAFLLVEELTDLTIVSRSWQSTGFDYWLGPKGTPCEVDLPFNNAVRLEISGIYEGNDQRIQSRVRTKIKQTNQSDHLKLPAYVIIVEFGRLLSKFVEKKP